MFSLTNAMRSLLLLLFITVLAVAYKLPRQKIPRFEDYPVKEGFQGKPAPVKLSSRQARMYRTVLREGAKEGPNFAGSYTIVGWGCGTSCLEFAVVDSKTGDVYFPGFKLYEGLMEMPDKLKGEQPSHYRIDSRLVVAYGSATDDGKGIHYYRWDGKRFRHLGSVF